MYKVLITTSSFPTGYGGNHCQSIIVEYTYATDADKAVENAVKNSNEHRGVRVAAVRLN